MKLENKPFKETKRDLLANIKDLENQIIINQKWHRAEVIIIGVVSFLAGAAVAIGLLPC